MTDNWQKRVILVHGKKRSGKDTFAEVAKDFLVRAKTYHFADPLKEDLLRRFPPVKRRHLYGTTEERESIIPEMKISGRRLMQIYGTDMISTLWNPAWADAALRYAEDFAKGRPSHILIIPDLRRQIELKWFEPYKASVLKIVRPGNDDGDTHSSETELDCIKFRNVIVNDGTLEEFKTKCESWLNNWSWY